VPHGGNISLWIGRWRGRPQQSEKIFFHQGDPREKKKASSKVNGEKQTGLRSSEERKRGERDYRIGHSL